MYYNTLFKYLTHKKLKCRTNCMFQCQKLYTKKFVIMTTIEKNNNLAKIQKLENEICEKTIILINLIASMIKDREEIEKLEQDEPKTSYLKVCKNCYSINENTKSLLVNKLFALEDELKSLKKNI